MMGYKLLGLDGMIPNGPGVVNGQNQDLFGFYPKSYFLKEQNTIKLVDLPFYSTDKRPVLKDLYCNNTNTFIDNIFGSSSDVPSKSSYYDINFIEKKYTNGDGTSDYKNFFFKNVLGECVPQK
jgi:hypothetical protein